ncbi:uncharacterized protein [Cherax quadricarinatus]
MDERYVDQILRELDRRITHQVKENAKVVDAFVKELQKQFRTNTFLYNAHFVDVMHGGSAYEALSVKLKTDFDIIIVLPDPYIGQNFEVQRDPSKYFKLKWKNQARSGCQGFLNAAQLQKQAFEELEKCVSNVHAPGVREATYRLGLAACTVTLKKFNNTIISIDLAPQIAVRDWKSSHLVKLQSLPQSLQSYISTLERNCSPIYFFSPAVPGNAGNKDYLCNISFSMLEKEFLKSNVKVRDMVRLVKLVGEAFQWPKKFGLKSFYIKRLAVKYFDELKNKTKWDGYKYILACLYKELQETKTIDGFFVTDQITYKKKPENTQEFLKDINVVYHLSSTDVQQKVKFDA